MECTQDFGEKARRNGTTRTIQGRWEDNIKTDFRKNVAVDSMDLTQDREEWCALLTVVINLQAP